MLMKKFLLSLAAVFCATSMYAEEVEVALTEGHTLEIENLVSAGATDSSIIRFYIANESGESRSGWGIGGFANSDNWTPIEEWKGQEGDSWTF